MEKRYSIGEKVIYSQSGVCQIVDITESEFYGEKTEYYVLRPVYDSGSLVYVPTDNVLLVSRIRCAMTRDEVGDLIDYMSSAENIWIDNDNKRKEAYAAILLENKPERITEMISTLRCRREEQKLKKKRLHISDEHFLERAQRILGDEISFVLGLDREDVDSYITSRLTQDNVKDA